MNGLTQTSGLGLVTIYALLATFSMIGALTAVFWLDALTGRTFLLVVVHVAMMLPIKFKEHGVVRLGHLIPNRSISTVGQHQAFSHSVCQVSSSQGRGRTHTQIPGFCEQSFGWIEKGISCRDPSNEKWRHGGTR
jgi:hypothetical protein